MADDRREREIPGRVRLRRCSPIPAEVERLREEVRRLREEQDRQRSALSAAGNGGGASQGTSNRRRRHNLTERRSLEKLQRQIRTNETPKRPWYREHPIKALFALIVIDCHSRGRVLVLAVFADI